MSDWERLEIENQNARLMRENERLQAHNLKLTDANVRLSDTVLRLQKKCDYKDGVIDQRNAECSRQFREIERLRERESMCHERVLEQEIERLQKQCDYKDGVIDQRNAECSRQFREIERLRTALERIEQLDERMAPITNMVRAKEIAREALEGER